MKSIELVYFHRNQNNLFVAGIDKNCIALNLLFQMVDIEKQIYINENLSSSDDIVDDLLFDGMDIICFIVNKENQAFVKTVANYLKKVDSNVEIICLLSDEVTLNFDIHVCMPYEKSYFPLLTFLDTYIDEDILRKIPLESIYRNRLVPVNRSNDIGIIVCDYIEVLGENYSNHPKEIMEEIKYIVDNQRIQENIVLYCKDDVEYPYKEEFRKCLDKLDIKEKIIIRREEEKKKDYKAFDKGLDAFYTGLYGKNLETAYTKHIQIESKELSKQTMKDIALHNAANSAVYGISSDRSMTFEEVEELAVESDFLFSNYLEFKRNKEENHYNVVMNGEVSTDVTILPYSQFNKNILEQQHFYLEISNENDLNELIMDIKNYKSTGILINERMWKYAIVDVCRWYQISNCDLCNLPRMLVKNQKVYPCLSCEESIGDINDMHFDLLKNASMKSEEKQIQYGCDQCDYRNKCAKCAMLPSFISASKYCETIKSNLEISEYFKNMAIIRAFFEFNAISKLKGIPIETLQFVTKQNEVNTKQVKPEATSRIGKFVMLCKVINKDIYIVMDLVTKRAFSVNRDLFILIELLYKGKDEGYISNYMIEKFNTSEEIVKDFINKSFSFLSEKGILMNDAL